MYTKKIIRTNVERVHHNTTNKFDKKYYHGVSCKGKDNIENILTEKKSILSNNIQENLAMLWHPCVLNKKDDKYYEIQPITHSRIVNGTATVPLESSIIEGEGFRGILTEPNMVESDVVKELYCKGVMRDTTVKTSILDEAQRKCNEFNYTNYSIEREPLNKIMERD